MNERQRLALVGVGNSIIVPLSRFITHVNDRQEGCDS